jgi:hypothetical protein
MMGKENLALTFVAFGGILGEQQGKASGIVKWLQTLGKFLRSTWI